MDTPASSAELATEASVTPRRRVPMWRRIVSAVCIVLSCVIVPFSVLALWLHDDLLETGGYVETITPLAENQDVLEAMSRRITNALFDNVDIETLAKEALPPRIAFLAGPLTTELEDFIRDFVLDFLESERFRSLWVTVNTAAHEQVTKALEGGGEVLETEDGHVVLDLKPVADRLRSALDDRGISIFDNVRVDPERLRFELINAEGLEKAQAGVRLLDTLRWVLPVVVFALGALGVFLAGNRRKALIRWGIGVVVATLVLGFGLALGRDLMLDALPPDASRAAASAAYDIIVRLLRNTNRILFAVGLIVALGAFLAGSSRFAVAIRGRATGALDHVGDRAASTEASFFGVPGFVARHATLLRVAGAVLSFVILIALDHPDATTVLWLLLALIVFIGIVTIFERIGRDRAANPSGAR